VLAAIRTHTAADDMASSKEWLGAAVVIFNVVAFLVLVTGGLYYLGRHGSNEVIGLLAIVVALAFSCATTPYLGPRKPASSRASRKAARRQKKEGAEAGAKDDKKGTRPAHRQHKKVAKGETQYHKGAKKDE
jgi:hypothetical protein